MIPHRMCVVCRERREKSELVRVTKNKQGNISLDKSGKAEGRGAYICKSGECIKNAEKRRAFERSFGGRVDKEFYLSLTEICDGSEN